MQKQSNEIMSKATRKDAVNWFELYVNDFDRAKRFYETVLQAPLQESATGPCRMAMFPLDMLNGVGGSISKTDGLSAGQGGTLVYLNVEGDLDFRGTLGVAKDQPVGFKEIRLRFDLDTEAPAEQVSKLISLTESYCVVYQTLRQPPQLKFL